MEIEESKFSRDASKRAGQELPGRMECSDMCNFMLAVRLPLSRGLGQGLAWPPRNSTPFSRRHILQVHSMLTLVQIQAHPQMRLCVWKQEVSF